MDCSPGIGSQPVSPLTMADDRKWGGKRRGLRCKVPLSSCTALRNLCKDQQSLQHQLCTGHLRTLGSTGYNPFLVLTGTATPASPKAQQDCEGHSAQPPYREQQEYRLYSSSIITMTNAWYHHLSKGYLGSQLWMLQP